MNEDDTFSILRASSIVNSSHGGYYYFIPDYNVRQIDPPSDRIFGNLFCCGPVYDIIKNKTTLLSRVVLLDTIFSNFSSNNL